jgi:hypothetical protein
MAHGTNINAILEGICTGLVILACRKAYLVHSSATIAEYCQVVKNSHRPRRTYHPIFFLSPLL